MTQASEVSALNSLVKARNTLDPVLGRRLEVNKVDIEEAYDGKVKRPPSPPPLENSAVQAAAK